MIISGTLYDAGGTLPNIKIRFRAQQTTLNGVVQSSVKDFETQPDGTYSITLEPGYYSVYWVEERSVVPLGNITADDTSEMTLPEALGSEGIPVTEEQAEDFLSLIVAAREAADASALAASASEASAQASATSADASAVAASGSATSAAISEANASDSAALATASADSAALASSSASDSATAASVSESNAQASEDAALLAAEAANTSAG